MWLKDIHVNEDTRINLPTSFYGLHQMISRPRHMLANPSLCIDLIFISQLNFIVDCGVHPSLHSNCHHQNTYSKLNVITEYPPPYHRLVWDFRNAKYMSLMTFDISSYHFAIMTFYLGHLKLFGHEDLLYKLTNHSNFRLTLYLISKFPK